jgi:hypothetical protein
VNDETAAAAAQAAPRFSAAEIDDALGALDFVYGDEYEFGWDPAVGFWVRRHGAIGCLLTAADPRELGTFLADDIRARS